MIKKLNEELQCNAVLYYGEDLFINNKELKHEMWFEIKSYSDKYKKEIEHNKNDMSNFDAFTLSEIKDILSLKPNIIKNLLTNKYFREKMLPHLSPKGIFLNKLVKEISKLKNKKYLNLLNYVN